MGIRIKKFLMVKQVLFRGVIKTESYNKAKTKIMSHKIFN